MSLHAVRVRNDGEGLQSSCELYRKNVLHVEKNIPLNTGGKRKRGPFPGDPSRGMSTLFLVFYQLDIRDDVSPRIPGSHEAQYLLPLKHLLDL